MARVDVDTPWPERFERNVRIVEAYGNGRTLVQIAEEIGITYQNVSIILRQAGIDPRSNRGRIGGGPPRWNGPRDLEIAKARAAGETLAAIGTRYAVSKQRIAQILESLESNGKKKP